MDERLLALLEVVSKVALVVADCQKSCVGFDLVTWRRASEKEAGGVSLGRNIVYVYVSNFFCP